MRVLEAIYLKLFGPFNKLPRSCRYSNSVALSESFDTEILLLRVVLFGLSNLDDC